MKNVTCFIFPVCLLLCSFTHKFYVGIFQIDHNAAKKRLEISCRIFADDLDKALEKKYKHPFHFADGKMPQQDMAQLQLYISEKFTIKVNGKAVLTEFKKCELESNVLVSYMVSNGVSAPTKIGVGNTILMEYVTSQQNIIQIKSGANKQSMLLTADNPSASVDF